MSRSCPRCRGTGKRPSGSSCPICCGRKTICGVEKTPKSGPHKGRTLVCTRWEGHHLDPDEGCQFHQDELIDPNWTITWRDE